ncbi:MAG TPA: hypothetical protein VLF62_02250 [Candidatus Saccharimonadales bacterium]|nr:hypothetical protein [Candidatus Saccharimonadales bacterium]
MHATTGLWMTHHGLKKLQRERADLQDWLGHSRHSILNAVHNHRTDREIDLILFEKESIANRLKRVDDVLHQDIALPPVREHKTEARAGDIPLMVRKITKSSK